jgi:hypothetical protein
MCFVLYMATDVPVPTIPWNENNRRLNTQDLSEHDRLVASHFTKPYKKYVGSDLGCGCGFRSVSFQNGEWPEEAMIGYEDHTGEEEQPNHQQLFDFLAGLMCENREIELYGCWDGDFVELSAGHAKIALSKILDKKFFFRERYKYIVINSEQVAGGNGGQAAVP